MARKTTKVAKMAIEKHDSFRATVEESIKKQGFLRSTDLIAKLEGIEILLLDILELNNCYHGFKIVDCEGNATQEDEPRWRVSYYISE